MARPTPTRADSGASWARLAAARRVRTPRASIANTISGATRISGTAQPSVLEGSKWKPVLVRVLAAGEAVAAAEAAAA